MRANSTCRGPQRSDATCTDQTSTPRGPCPTAHSVPPLSGLAEASLSTRSRPWPPPAQLLTPAFLWSHGRATHRAPPLTGRMPLGPSPTAHSGQPLSGQVWASHSTRGSATTPSGPVAETGLPLEPRPRHTQGAATHRALDRKRSGCVGLNLRSTASVPQPLPARAPRTPAMCVPAGAD